MNIELTRTMPGVNIDALKDVVTGTYMDFELITAPYCGQIYLSAQTQYDCTEREAIDMLLMILSAAMIKAGETQTALLLAAGQLSAYTNQHPEEVLQELHEGALDELRNQALNTLRGKTI